MHNPTFAIGIPTINRADLLNPALEQYVVDFPNTQILIVDNGGQQIFQHANIKVFSPLGKNLGVAGSWNMICTELFYARSGPRHKYALIMNDDIEFGKTEKDCMVFLAENCNEDFIVAPANWCNFFIPERTFNKVGEFDAEFYPAYFEDNDYHYRMQLLGLTYFPSLFMSPKVYRNSQTIAKNMGLNTGFDSNKSRFLSKWGGMPSQEVFKTPFNR